MRIEPCDWPVADVECDALDGLDYGLAEQVRAAAGQFLWRWTGRRFGVCPAEVRPCLRDPRRSTWRGRAGAPSSWRGWEPVLIAGRWHHLDCDDCDDPARTVRLPGPVAAVTEVEVDGAVLDPSAWRLDNRARLVRQDGHPWPVRQRLDRPLGETDTWAVRFDRGSPVPDGGQVAAAVLACEMAKAVVGDRSCALPQRVRSINREGISTTILDSFDDLESGRTGIWIVDSWVATEQSAPKRPTVYSPDRSQRSTL